MGSYPWGPHGPETRPYDVRPNPTPQSVFPNIGGGDFAAAPVGAYGLPPGAPTGSGGPHVSIIASLVMLPFVWMFWICLYPLTAAVGVITTVLTSGLAMRYLSLQRDEASVALGFGIIAGFIAVAIFSRIEYRMAQNIGYRVARHAVRLVLFGVLALPWIQAMVFDVAGGSETRYIYGALTHPRFLMAQMAIPQNLAIVAAVMVGMHFLLWKGERVRSFWHRRLMWLGLK
jgi:hypothetical protein